MTSPSSIRGGAQVAWMALRGPSALQPGLLELQVRLPPGGPRILLVNALTLMPGTLGVELARKTLRLHVLDERLPVDGRDPVEGCVDGRVPVEGRVDG